MLRLETDLGRYQTFIINAGKVKIKQQCFLLYKLIYCSLYLHYLMNNNQMILNQNQNVQRIMKNKMQCNKNLI